MIDKIKGNLLRSWSHTELTITDLEAQQLLAQINCDTFKTLDYQKKSSVWPWFTHVKNLAELAGKRNLMAKESAKATVVQALRAFLNLKPADDTIWYQQIGLPRYLGRLYLLLEQDLTDKDKEILLTYIKNGSVAVTPALFSQWVGTNLLWAVTNTLVYGVITNDLSLLSQGIQVVEKELNCHQKGEYGLQEVYGFVPYPTQFYHNESCYTFAKECAYLVFALQGTDYQLSLHNLNVLGFYFVFGLRYHIRNKGYDYLTVGKSLATPDALNAEDMRKAMWMFLNTEGMACQDVMQEQIASLSYEMYSVKNDKYVPATNEYISRRVTSHLSCLGTSPDTKIDAGNVLENGLSAHFYAGGATCIMTDGKEYDNIFPVWDFAHIPGTTTPTEVCRNFQTVQNSYCSGYSHNEVGTLYQDLNFGGVTGVTARFFIDGMMIALGADLSCEKDCQVTTTLNQCWQTDEIQQYDNGFYQGNVVYATLDEKPISVESQEKTGNWSALNKEVNKTESGKVCTFFIDHGVAPKEASYAYVVIPAVAKGNAKDRLEQLAKDVKVLKNDQTMQAIQYKNKVYCVFHKSGVYSVDRYNHVVGDERSVHVFKI